MAKKDKQNGIFTRISQFFGGGGTPCQPSKKEVGSVSESPIKEEYERCILCGQVTCIPVSMPIDWRENYEVGLGQVCAECAKKQREATERETLSHAKILRAVELSRKESNKK